MKKLLCFYLLLLITVSLQAQLSITKLVGKNASDYKLGYCLFTYLDFPLNAEENKSIRVELLDLSIYPGKTGGSFFTNPNGKGCLSIRAGYKNIFSETKTGFYIEPSLGWCRVVHSEEGPGDSYADGLAAALEGGYSLEVGENGHAFVFGLKYETDRASDPLHTLNSIGFRLSYTFNLLRKKD